MSVISLISPRLFVSASLQPSPSYLLGFSSRHHFSPYLTAVLCFLCKSFLRYFVSDVWLPVNTLRQFSASFRHVPLSLLYFLLSLSLCLFLCFGCASCWISMVSRFSGWPTLTGLREDCLPASKLLWSHSPASWMGENVLSLFLYFYRH